MHDGIGPVPSTFAAAICSGSRGEDLSKKRILIVDDELVPGQAGATYMWYYVQALRDAGFDVKEAITVDEAVEALACPGAEYDLVILDIMMPPGQAFERAASLRGLRTGVLLAKVISDTYPRVPMVVLTNRFPWGSQELEGISNVRRTLYKPDCTPFMLAEEVKGLLES
jgi:CheY-like chemotaxis protein